MKLARYGDLGQERPVVFDDEGFAYDGSSVAYDDYGRRFFEYGGVDRLRAALEARSLARIDLEGERIGAPVSRPGKVICIGLNYADHAAEAELLLPEEPVVFFKAPNSVVGPEDRVMLPLGGSKTDWEVELGIIVGSGARYLDDAEAGSAAIAGFCVSNDVSERSFQFDRGGQWVKGKSCETFNPLGPWLVPVTDVRGAGSLDMWVEVNGESVQYGNTGNMVFSPGYIVWYLSQFMVLEAGDLINTGTPAGVGHGSDPPRYLLEGDVMEVGIQGLGSQRLLCQRARR